MGESKDTAAADERPEVEEPEFVDPDDRDPLDEVAAVLGEAPIPANEPAPIPAIRAFDRLIGIAEHILVVSFLLMLIGVAVYQVVAGHLFNHNPTWPKELIQFSVFLVAMSGAALAAQTDQMMSMDIVTRMVSPKSRVLLRLVTRIFTIIICGFLLLGAWKAREIGIETGEQVIDIRLVVLALPFGAGLIGLHVLLHGLIEVVYLSRGELPPEPAAPAAH